MKSDDCALGAAIARGLAAGNPAGECPALETVAQLVDGTLADVERDRLLGHLAACDSCRDLFLASSQLAHQQPAEHRRAGARRRNYLFPSALAAAAVLIIAVTLQLRAPGPDRGEVARKAEQAPPRAVLSERSAGTPSPSEGVARIAQQKPRSAGKRAVAREASAPDGTSLARLLIQHGDPEKLAFLAAAKDKEFGFAVRGEAKSLAFRIGVNLMNLEVALLADDGDRAQAQAARLAPLLEMLAGTPDTAVLDRMVASLDQGEPASRSAGKSGELERLVPRDQVPYARLGAWAQGARLAARSGNRQYLAGGVPRYFNDRVADASVPNPAASALRALELQLRKPGSIDLELVERDVAILLGAF